MNIIVLLIEIVNISGMGFGDGGFIYVVVGMLFFFSVIGIIGNVFVLYVYMRKCNKLVVIVFIILLVIIDLMISIVVMLYIIVIEYLNYYVKYDILCKMYMFFIILNVFFVVFIMVGIVFDRYFCIVYLFKYLMNV